MLCIIMKMTFSIGFIKNIKGGGNMKHCRVCKGQLILPFEKNPDHVFCEECKLLYDISILGDFIEIDDKPYWAPEKE